MSAKNKKKRQESSLLAFHARHKKKKIKKRIKELFSNIRGYDQNYEYFKNLDIDLYSKSQNCIQPRAWFLKLI